MMVKVYLILAVYLLFPILIVSAFHKWHFLQKIGTVILAYAVGVVMALTGVVAFEPDTAEAAAFTQMQNWLMNLSVPIAIPLMLFGCDFKLWTKSLPKTLFALLGGTVAVLVAVVSGFFVFRPAGIDDLANVSAMMTGIYTGEGRRDWVFYTLSTNIFGRKLNEALASLPLLPISIYCENDPSWGEYDEMKSLSEINASED